MLRRFLTVCSTSAAYCYIVRDSMLCCWIVPPYCINACHNVGTVRHTDSSGSSQNMLCWTVTVCCNSATYCYVVRDSMFCCWCFPPLWSIRESRTACVDHYAMLSYFSTLCSHRDIMFRWMNTIIQYGVKLNMMAGPLATRPFSPCDRWDAGARYAFCLLQFHLHWSRERMCEYVTLCSCAAPVRRKDHLLITHTVEMSVRPDRVREFAPCIKSASSRIFTWSLLPEMEPRV
jgi:hypothetical protein